MPPPTGDTYNVDWVVSSTSSCCIATSREWFKNYTPFPTSIGHTASDVIGDVLGVGDVELEIRRFATAAAAAARPKGSKNSTKIVLKDVLYAPTYVCNVAGTQLFQKYDVSFGADAMILRRDTQELVGLIDRPKLPKLLLKGQSKGATSLNRHQEYTINATWSDAERERWQVHMQTQNADKKT